jgi:(2Fe-2S) ferredoxin
MRPGSKCASTRRVASIAVRGGPVAVVYPEGTWYTFVDKSDIDEIVDQHLLKGQVVERLVLPADVGR